MGPPPSPYNRACEPQHVICLSVPGVRGRPLSYRGKLMHLLIKVITMFRLVSIILSAFVVGSLVSPPAAVVAFVAPQYQSDNKNNRPRIVSPIQQQQLRLPAQSRLPVVTFLASTNNDNNNNNNPVERGVSVDQDGKSNVWAIEPKMEVSSKSSEETTQTALIAGVGLGLAAVAAIAILTNLPDPSQF